MRVLKQWVPLICNRIMRFVYNNDWPDLDKYQKANSLLTKPKSGENRIVLMGDSITELWSQINPAFFLDNSFLNRGISGQTTSQLLLRFKQDVIHLHPKVVVLLAGINDVAENTGPITIEQIADNIFSMVELAKVHDIHVILCSVLPANKFNWNAKIQPANKVVELNDHLRNYALINNIYFVDYYPRMHDALKGLKIEYGEDGIHPNVAGYQVMEPLLKEAINSIIHL